MKQLLTLTTIILLTAIACKREIDTNTTKKVPFTNVLILGNSITYSTADTSIGWNGNWGMAASAAEKDYVHLLTAKFKQNDASSIVQAVNIAEFERNADTYDFDTKLKSYRDGKPDLLILRIGENVDSKFDSVAFAKRYQDLLAYMKVDNPNLTILAAGSFWPDRDYINVIMSRYTPYISLSFLGDDISNYALDMKNVSDGVKQHPNDKGMQGIADAVWTKIEELNE